MLRMIFGMFVGLIGGYFLIYNEFDKFGKQCGFRCDRCKCNYCIAKRCWTKYNHLNNIGGVNIEKNK